MPANTRLNPPPPSLSRASSPVRTPLRSPVSFATAVALARRSSLGDPRLDRAGSGAKTSLWNPALLDRLHSPLTRYRD